MESNGKESDHSKIQRILSRILTMYQIKNGILDEDQQELLRAVCKQMNERQITLRNLGFRTSNETTMFLEMQKKYVYH